MAVAKLLCEEKRVRGEIKQTAKILGVTPRSLENWIKMYKCGGNAKVGRPSYSTALRKHAIWLVEREMIKQGYPGSRVIDKTLKGEIPTRLIQELVKKYKARKRKRDREKRLLNKKSSSVLMKNAYWVQDGTHLGRIERKAIESQVIKDRGSLKTLGIKTGTTADAKDIVTFFEGIKKSRGLPLVIGTDNGSAYCNEQVKTYLKQEKVVHLLSLPRTPEHNGSAEITMCELKKEAVLGKGMALDCPYEAHALLVKAAERINDRLRASKKFKSANEIDDMLVDARDMIDRDLFFEECERGISLLTEKTNNVREQRMLERELIMGTLEKHGAIKRTRGDGTYGEKCEVFL